MCFLVGCIKFCGTDVAIASYPLVHLARAVCEVLRGYKHGFLLAGPRRNIKWTLKDLWAVRHRHMRWA